MGRRKSAKNDPVLGIALIVVVIVVFFVSKCSSYFAEKETEELQRKSQASIDSLSRVQAERATERRLKLEREHPEIIAKEKARYEAFQKKKSIVEAKINKMIESCYGWSKFKGVNQYSFNTNCYEEKMQKLGLHKGQFTYWYEGMYQGHRLVIEHHGAVPTNSGWSKQRIDVKYLLD
ncbi:hypothetical protein [Xanthocytophaga agilis]|uniref:Uncharacterized protein n=1 Tax=Xanthocytophaga agilis TaxID=3048010 RepID=A0AAE3QZ09_9BACT|nr:hypothetical protein [Xanthocytophaga agilis]MDJ1500654.1 hypothetical protein [Xanthocytophaga agilis]